MPTLDEIESTWRTAVDELLASAQATQAATEQQLSDVRAELEGAQSRLSTALLQVQQDAGLIADLRAQIKALTPFVMDTTEATLENSGVPQGWTPKQVLRGDLNLTDGQVIEDADIYGRVFWTGAPVLNRCRIRGVPRSQLGTDLTKNTALICGWNGSAGRLRAYQCDLVPDESSWLVDGVAGHDWYLERCLLRYLTDGASSVPTAAGAKVTGELAGCWIGEHAFWTQAGTGQRVHPSDTKTHCDGAQLHGGSGFSAHGSTFWSFFAPKGIGRGTDDWPDVRANSCLQYNDNKGQLGPSDVHHNRMHGGQVHVNVPQATPGQDLGGVYSNLMALDSRLGKGGLVRMQASPSTTFLPKLDWHGNVDLNGAEVRASRG